MIFVGVDAGKYGAVGAVNADGTKVRVWDMPLDKDNQLDFRAMGRAFDELLAFDSCLDVTIEAIKPMPHKIDGVRVGRGSISSLKLGISYGAWRREIASRGIVPHCVDPARWKAIMLGGLPKGKQTSVDHASRLFPSFAHLFRGPKGGLLDDRAEAVLLAELGRRTWKMLHGRATGPA